MMNRDFTPGLLSVKIWRHVVDKKFPPVKHVYTYTYIYIYLCIYVYTYMHVHVHVYIYRGLRDAVTLG
jgi:hypothetical protein